MTTWDGELNTDFLTAMNWAGDVAPGPGDVVNINNGGLANQPVLNSGGSATVNSVNLSSGTLTLNDSLTSTSGFFVTGGLLQLNLTGDIVGNVTVGGVGSYNVIGTHTGDLSTLGGSTTIAAGATISGSVTVQGGSVDVTGVHNFADLEVSSGSVLNLTNAVVSVNSLSGSGGNVTLSATSGQTSMEFGTDNSSTSYSGLISIGSSTNLVKVGNGTSEISAEISGLGKVSVNGGALNLSGVNTYSGVTQVTGTTLLLSGTGSLANSTVALASAGHLDVSNTVTGTSIASLSIAGAGNIVEMGGKALNILAQGSSLTGTTFNGGTGADALSISLTMSSLHLSFLNFTNWTSATDLITVVGNSSSNTMSESEYRDHLQGGQGSDNLIILGQFSNVAGEVFDGGDGFDILSFDGSTSGTTRYYLRDDTLVSIEKLTLATPGGGNRSILLNANQFGSGIALDAQVGTEGTITSIQTFDIAMRTATSLNLSSLTFAAGTETVRFIVRGDGDADTVTGTLRNDTIIGAGGIDNLNGGDGKDSVRGGSGGDLISGGLGNDSLRGEAGNDALNGGSGKDLLLGGTGSDSFEFIAGDSGKTINSIDRISDFKKGALNIGDSLDFSSALSMGGSNAAATNSRASINATTGVATFAAGSGTTFNDAINDIARRFTSSSDSAGEFALFRVNGAGDYYVFISDGVAGVGTDDVIVRLQHISSIGSIDLTGGDLTILT